MRRSVIRSLVVALLLLTSLVQGARTLEGSAVAASPDRPHRFGVGAAPQVVAHAAQPTPTLGVATVTPTPAAAPTAAPGPRRLLVDDTFGGSTTIMPLDHGRLFLDSSGYEMVNAADDPKNVIADPVSGASLSAFSAAASMGLVSGDDAAGYGIGLFNGDLSYYVELDRQGKFSVQRVGGGKRSMLLDWTANAAIRQGSAPNRIALDLASGLLSIQVNGTPVGFVELPDGGGSFQVGLVDDGGKVTTQVRCTRFTVWTGSAALLDDRFADNAAGWSLGPTFAIAGGAMHLSPPPGGGSLSSFPQNRPPLASFMALETIAADSGPPDGWVGGISFLAIGGVEYTYELLGDGRFSIDRWHNGWHTLLRRSSPALHTGTESNTLFASYASGQLTVGANGAILATLLLDSPPLLGQVGVRIEAQDTVHVTHFLLLAPDDPRIALVPAPDLPVDRVALRDSFAGDSGAWQLARGLSTIRDHALRLTLRAADTVVWANTRRLSLGQAYSVAAQMRLTVATHTDSPYALLCALDPARSDGEFLAFSLTADGYYALSWLHRGKWQRDLIPYTRSDLIMQGTSANLLRVDVLRSRVHLFLNGVHLADAALPSSAVGTQIGAMTSTGNDLAVTDVQVTRLIPLAVPLTIVPPAVPTPRPQPVAPPLNDPQRAAKERVAPAVVQVVVATLFAHNRPAYGTGLIVLADRTGIYMLTAHHVVNHVFPGDARRIAIRLQSGSTLVANGVALASGGLDLALVRFPPRAGVHAAMLGDSAAIASPDQVLALGYPDLAGYSSTQPFVQAGTVQNTQEQVTGLQGTYFAHSAAVAEGMSGGPLVLAQPLAPGGRAQLGTVIGINLDYARLVTGPRTIVTNPALNLNISLPSNAARAVLTTLLARLHPGSYALPEPGSAPALAR